MSASFGSCPSLARCSHAAVTRCAASLFFTPDPVTDWYSAAKSDKAAFTKFFWGMLEEGFYLAPSPFEALFLSTAHTTSDIQATLDASARVLEEVFGRGSRT